MDPDQELARWPSKGGRRNLEERWLERLEQSGDILEAPEISQGTPSELSSAVAEFNSGLFWECHETLEDLWRNTPYPERFFYHAIIKAAVGFYHLSRHNLHGGRVKLSDAVRLLSLFRPGRMGLRTDLLLKDTSEWLGRLSTPVDWAALDAMSTPTIRSVDSVALRDRPEPDRG